MRNAIRLLLSAGAVVVVGLILVLSDECSGQSPAKPSELKVLERYIGTWKFEIISKPAEWTPKETRRTGTSTNEWVLDGWFQHHKVKEADGSEGIDILTFDPHKKTYRVWSFATGGFANEMAGEWDEQSKTMTTKADLDNGVVVVTKMRFLDKDHRESTLLAKDAAGKIYLDMSGKLARQK